MPNWTPSDALVEDCKRAVRREVMRQEPHWTDESMARAVLSAAVESGELVVLSREERNCILSAFNFCRQHGAVNKYADELAARLSDRGSDG